MNRGNIKWIVLMAALGVIGVYVGLARDKRENTRASITPVVAKPQTAVVSQNQMDANAHEHDAKVNEHMQFIEFQKRARLLFDHADTLSEQQKQEELNAIADAASHFENQGKLVAMEALLLKLAMLRYTTSGEEEYKNKAQALVAHYKSLSDAKEQAWLNNPDPRFVDYKRREQDIVKDVMAMTVIPDGLSRDEYLRQQLEQARIAAMGDGGG